MRRLLVFITIICAFSSAHSQGCGTEASEKTIKSLRRLRNVSSFSARSVDLVANPVKLAITAHIIRDSEGNGGLGVSALDDAIIKLNEFYNGVGLQFYVRGDINYIDNDDYVSFDSSQEDEIISVNNVSNTINIYFFNSLSSGEFPLCGYAYFPDTGRDQIMMANGCTISGATLPHEIGHYLALYHTHGKTNTGTTDELVDGTNCDITGDDVCDTPADPNLTSLVDSNTCGYFGALVDGNNEAFQPDPRNIMAYSQDECMVLFTEGQKERMRNAYLTYKTYLIQDDFLADWSVAKKNACLNEDITFQNLSSGYDSFEWTFGNGSSLASSTDLNPVVSFSEIGYSTFTLTLMKDGVSTELVDSLFVGSETATSGEEISSGFETNYDSILVNPDNDVTFSYTDAVSSEGENSLFIPLFENRRLGSNDYVILGVVEASTFSYFDVSFDYAYAFFSDANADGLQLVYRDNCGDWMVLWEQYGQDLATTTSRMYFTPDESDWKRISIEFNAPSGEFELALRTVNAFGNNLYLDNYLIKPNDPAFKINTLSSTDVTCPGETNGRIVANVEGSGSLEYSLDNTTFQSSNEFEGLGEGDYTVYVRNGATGITEFETAKIEFQSDFPIKPIIFISDSEIKLSTSLFPGESILWYYNGVVMDGENGTDIATIGRGVYQAEVRNDNCGSFSDELVILSSEDEIDTPELSVYPNPIVGDNIRIQSSLDEPIQMFSLSGELLLTLDYNKEGVYQISQFANGIYLIRQGGESQKIIIDRR